MGRKAVSSESNNAASQSSPAKKRNENLKTKSPAEFFMENKNIAGFDNPGKSLYTTIRELVENGLDAAESINVLPEVEVTVMEMSKATYNKLIGLEEVARVDMDLYETDKPGKKKLPKKPKQDPKKGGTGNEIDNEDRPEADGISAAPIEPKDKEAARKEVVYFKITVKDNGVGMAHDDIPEMLGKVLSGTKYGIKQTRGKFGLGSKMALIWSKMSTGLPIEIRSARKNQSFVSYCKLDIDIRRNIPNIKAHEKPENAHNWRGTEISVTVEGNWTTYKARILQYMRLMAVITPYAHFDFRFVSEHADKSFTIRYARRTDQMPPPAQEVKHHPSAVNLLLLKQLIQDTRHQHLDKYLIHEFSSIDKPLAHRLIAELGDEFSPQMAVKSMSDQQIVRVLQLLRAAKFHQASGDCLSPAGEYNLRLGIIKQLQPEFVATYQEPVRVFEGHPFIVEAGVSLGGKAVKQGITVFRFANRIPLLFEGGGDVVTRTAFRSINWSQYKIRQNEDKIGVFVSIVSTKIPFKGTGKENIGDDIEEIKAAVKHAIAQCCVQLKVKLTKAAALRERASRKRNLTRYIPDVSRALYGVLSEMLDDQATASGIKKARLTSGGIGDLLAKVKAQEVTEPVISHKLTQYVEQVDSEQALEYVASTGLGDGARDDVWLVPLQLERTFMAKLGSPLCSVRLFEP